jgi:hypothetical protein
MAAQKRKINYRKIYESHYGSIPIDTDGKSYDIHHIDGDHLNNDPSNLTAIPIAEHYDIHYQQGDYYACYLIMIQRMNKTKEEISRIATLSNLKRVANGTNPLVGGKLQRESSKKYWQEMGENHPAAIATRERVKNGTHHLLAIGKDHVAYDHMIYCFENVKTGERVMMTQNDFLIKYNLHSGAVSDLVNRKRNVWSVKGWVLVDPVTSKPIIYQRTTKKNDTKE